jgi:hypothetical protein
LAPRRKNGFSRIEAAPGEVSYSWLDTSLLLKGNGFNSASVVSQPRRTYPKMRNGHFREFSRA